MATASQLAAQGIKSQYELPDWAKASGQAVDLATSGYWGPQEAGSGSGSVGNGDGSGFYSPLDQFAGQQVGNGYGQYNTGPNVAGAQDWLKSSGQQVMQARQGDQIVRWLQDAQGNVTAQPEVFSGEDKKFGLAALLAGGLVGGAAAGLYGGAGAGSAAAGAGAAEAGIGTLGTIAPGSAALAPMATTGALSTAPAITAAIPAAGGAVGAAGAVAGAGSAGSAGGSTLGNALKTGVQGMGASDWIQLAGLGAGLIQSNNAQDSADAFAGQTAQQAADMLAFSKAQYADSLPFIKAAQEKSLQVSDAQLASMKQQDALAKEYADYNRTTFRPLEQGIVANAQGYDTPEKRQSAADQALADVNMQFNARGAATARQLAASGVAPGSAKSMAVMGTQGVEQARVGAGAAQMARKGVETTGFARQMDAASLGRNLPSAQATSAGLGIQAGNSAVNTSLAGANAGTTQAGLAMNGISAANNMNLAAGRLQQGAQDAQNQLWSQLGQTAGRYFTGRP